MITFNTKITHLRDALAASRSVRCSRYVGKEPSVKAQDTKWRWHSEGTGQLKHTNVASRGGGLLPFFLRPAPGGGDDGA